MSTSSTTPSFYYDMWKETLVYGQDRTHGYTDAVVEMYVKHISAYLAQHDDLMFGHMESFIKAANTPGGRKRRYQALRHFATFLYDREEFTLERLNAMVRLREKDNRDPKQAVLSEEDIDTLIMHTDKLQYKAMLALFANTGLRVSEVCGLDIADIHLEQDLTRCWIRVKGETAKNGKPRIVGVNQELYQYMSQYLEKEKPRQGALFLTQRQRRFERRGVWERFQHLGKLCGIEDVHPHAFRRSFITDALRQGANIHLIKEAVGHSSVTMTERYAKFRSEDITSMMAGLR